MILSLKSVLKNKKLIYSLISQIITLSVSLMMTLGVTNYLSVENFGYWQLFVFYSSYIGLAHLGICDGIYLRYGGKNLTDFNTSKIKGLLYIYIISQLIIGGGILLYGLFSDLEYQRKFILYSLSILLLVTNFQTLLSYMLLSTSNIIENSRSIFIEKFLMLSSILVLILINKISFENLIISYSISKLFSLIYLLSFFKQFRKIDYYVNFQYAYEILKLGFVLMLANIVSTLIIGVGRYFIDKKWNIEIFGKISLAISLVYFFLVLLSQISFIIFPFLRNISNENQKLVYLKINTKISSLLKILILFYIPCTFILYKLLPTYKESINYLILLLPICLFDGKMQMIYVPFFKNLLLQKKLLYINIFCLFLSVILTVIGTYYFESILFILIGIIFSIICRSILAEMILAKIYKLKQFKVLLIDLIFTLLIVLYYFKQEYIFHFFIR